MSTSPRNQTHLSLTSPQVSERVLNLDGYLILKVFSISRKVTVVKRTNGSCTYLEVKLMFTFQNEVIIINPLIAISFSKVLREILVLWPNVMNRLWDINPSNTFVTLNNERIIRIR
jgi:hypothetical protein